MKAIRNNLAVVTLITISLIAARYLLLPGFIPTHDAEYHIIRLWQFDKVFRSGILIPRWAPDLNNGLGVPIFQFFYPLPNYIGETFHILGFSLIRSVYLTMALGFILSGLTFYLWLRCFFKKWPSATGAIFYLLAPYHLVDVFVRGSVGEIWALSITPLALYLTTKIILFQITQPKADPPLAENSITLSLLLLSHNILGVLFYFFSLAYGILLNYHAKKSALKPLLLSFTIGFLLAGFFWIPLILEREYIVGFNISNIQDHFPQLYQLIIPSWGTEFSGSGLTTTNQMSFQIGVPHLLVTVLALFVYLFKDRKNMLNIYFLITLVTSVFLMLGISNFIWEAFPFMVYFQHPWRLLSIVILLTSYFTGYLASRRKTWLSILLIIAALIFYLPYTRPVVYEPREDSFYLNNPTWTTGTATLGNSFRVKEGMEEQIGKTPVVLAGYISSIIGICLLIIKKR
jgi:uncharacterized membrane protein